MAINLVEKFLPYVDEQFSTESKKSLLTNQDFTWTGAHTVKVYKISTSDMNDYNAKWNEQAEINRKKLIPPIISKLEEKGIRKEIIDDTNVNGKIK